MMRIGGKGELLCIPACPPTNNDFLPSCDFEIDIVEGNCCRATPIVSLKIKSSRLSRGKLTYKIL